MPSFGEKSLERLATCHPKLRQLFAEVIKDYDCTILCGHRDQPAQDAAFRAGFSTKKWPESQHNKFPSLAVDVAPYPVDWEHLPSFYYFAGFVMGTANRLGIKIRWGGDWDRDKNLKNERGIRDLPHFELAEQA
jgi:peptidoglycan L-alanyl-D-glutamate endopeptidase CwlK